MKGNGCGLFWVLIQNFRLGQSKTTNNLDQSSLLQDWKSNLVLREDETGVRTQLPGIGLYDFVNILKFGLF